MHERGAHVSHTADYAARPLPGCPSRVTSAVDNLCTSPPLAPAGRRPNGRSAVASVLCQPAKWPDDTDDMAALYDSELNSVPNDLIPFHVVTRRPRSSDPRFDND